MLWQEVDRVNDLPQMGEAGEWDKEKFSQQIINEL